MSSEPPDGITQKRWGWVESRVAPGEARLETTPVYIFTGGPRPGGHAFLTDRQVIVAVTEPPIGTETRPLVWDVPLATVTLLGISGRPSDPSVNGPAGLLLLFHPDSAGQDASTVLDLYPSAISQRFLRALRELWVEIGRDDSGSDPAWDLWLADDAPMVTRSKAAWIRGK